MPNSALQRAPGGPPSSSDSESNDPNDSPSVPTTTTTTGPKSKTPCWTCRRRRVICDQFLPTCQKCSRAGRECLGYKKPLVWNKGVASRGKMMGKSFDEVKTYHKDLAAFATSKTLLEPTKVCDDVDKSTQSMDVVSSPPTWASNTVTQTSNFLRGALVDPIFQDFKPLTRFYLNYYAQKLSGEAILFDSGQNPYRDLMSLVGSSPLLLKTILATSARDFTNFNTYSASCSNWLSSVSDMTIGRSTSSYHALSYKQNALTQLRKDISQSDSELKPDLIFASISLLLFVEVLESGKNAWRVHLEGMKQLAKLKDSMSAINYDPTTHEVFPGNDAISFFFDSCITFEIMGNTLTRPYKISNPIPPTSEIYNSIQRSEHITFIGCPADLLYLILVINWQYWIKLHGADSTAAPSLLDTNDIAIINSIKSFSPSAWAQKSSLASPREDFVLREHLASAYKSAVLIYAVRALFPPFHSILDSVPITELAAEIVSHLSVIPIEDPFLKCIMWPSFMAGAETEDEVGRERVRDLFWGFWVGFRSKNGVNAVKVLEEIWKRADEGLYEKGSWCDFLSTGGVDWLFI